MRYTAGRALDDLVARVVMCEVIEDFRPSTDPKAASLVKQRLISLGYEVYIHWNRLDAEPESIRGWAVEVSHKDDDSSTWFRWVHADTEELALCLASAQAFGVDIGGDAV